MLSNEDRVDEVALAARAKAVKDLVKTRFELEPVQETNAYMTFLIGRDHAETLPVLLKELGTRRSELAISDLQVRPLCRAGQCFRESGLQHMDVLT